MWRCFLVVTIVAVGATTAKAEEPVELVRQHVVQYVGLKPSGGEIVLPVKSAKGAAESMTILAADADGLTVRSQGAESRVTWKTLGEEGIYQLAQPLMAKAPVFVEAAWLKAGIKLGHAGDAAFKEVLDKLREKDGEAAKVIESVMPPAPPKAEKAVDEGQSETQPPAGEATAEEAADDEKKMDFWLGRVVGPDGQINRAAYAAEAKKGDLAAINRMLGPDYAFYHGVAAGEGVPTCPEAPVKSTGKIGRNGAGFRYNLGNPSGDAGGYWTTEGQVLYVPTDRSDAGIDRVDFASFAHGCLVMLPEAAWWGGAHPDPVVNQAALRKAAAGPLGQPFAIERAYWSLSEQGYVLFKSGLLAAVTVNNVYDYPYFMFPKTKVPTALSLTSKSEFVLVTIWDTQTQRGQLAVLAVGATEKGRTAFGLPGWGRNNHLKLLGYVDLPIACPTGVSATSCVTAVLAPVRPTEFAVEDAKERAQRFKSDDISRAGYAAVISKSENKVVFVDLGPLLGFVREMGFTTQANAEKVRNAGLGDDQWPYTFEKEPRSKPRVVSTASVLHPTAVRVSPAARRHALAVVAGMGGDLHIFDASPLARDGASGAPRRTGFVKVGQNPCFIAYQRFADPFRKSTQGTGVDGWYSTDFVFLVACRGDREIDWVEVGSEGAKVYRRFKDSRFTDPVQVHHVRVNSPDHAYVFCVVDYKGRKILNYRLGEASIKGQSFPITGGKGEIEFTGSMTFPGNVFRVSADNLP